MYSYDIPGYGSYQTNDPAEFMERLSQLSWADMLPFFGMYLAVLALAVLVVIAWGRMFYKANLPWERIFVPIFGQFWQYRFAGCTRIFWANIIVPVLYVTGLSLLAANGSQMMAENLLPMLTAVMVVIMFVLHCIYCVKLSKSFGHGAGFGIGLLLLNFVFVLILGFGKSEYVGEYK